jgi:hypothetical protein
VEGCNIQKVMAISSRQHGDEFSLPSP